MINKIQEFLSQEITTPIFVRKYSLLFLLAIYDAYINKFKEVSDLEIVNVLAHRNEKGFFEFIVDFGDFTTKFVEKVNSKEGYTLLHNGVDRYYDNVKKLKDLIGEGTSNVKLSKEKIFELVSKILAFEAMTFVIHFIHKDLHIPLHDTALLEKCEKARLETEKLFTPGGEMDLFLGAINYVPEYLQGYTTDDGEFILFNNTFIYDKELINNYKKLKTERFEKNIVQNNEIKGNIAHKGKVRGKVKIIFSPDEFTKMNKGDILVASNTTPDYMPVIRLASAIITDEGGFLSHAAIVSRELKIPCVVGTQVATKALHDGDEVEVDANSGTITILNNK